MKEFEKNQDILEANLDIHMGSIGGWPTQVLAFIVGLFGASLPITGFFIWRGRKKKRKRDNPIKEQTLSPPQGKD